MSRARLAYKVLKVPLSHPYYRVPEILDVMRENFYLESIVYQSTRWIPPNYRQDAACGHRTHPGNKNDAPPPRNVGECSCGIYAFNTIDQAMQKARGAFGFRLCVAVAMWGRLRAHENALRAQKCQIMALIMPREEFAETGIKKSFNECEEAQLLSMIEENGLPIVDCGENWHNPAWVREWADDRNLTPQADMVEADKLLENLQAS